MLLKLQGISGLRHTYIHSSEGFLPHLIREGQNLASLIWWKIPSQPHLWCEFDRQPRIRERILVTVSEHTTVQQSMSIL